MAALLLYAAEPGEKSVPLSFFSADKLAHISVYGLLATHWLRALPRGWTWRPVLAIAITVLFGLADELLQMLNPVRTFDPLDWAADVIGAVTAVVAYRYWPLYRKMLELPVLRLKHP